MRRAIALVALAISLASSPPPGAAGTAAGASNACTCISPKRPPCEVWWQTSAIFVGRVTRVRTVEDEDADGQVRRSKIVTMRVGDRWQGVRGARDVEVRTGAGGGDCGFDFRRNRTYLVYAGQSVRTGRLETGICSRTTELRNADEDLAYLRALDDADPVVSVYGMVYRERQRLPAGDTPEVPLDPGGPMRGVEVELVGDGLEVSTTSDNEGWYEFEQLPVGEYEIRLQGQGIGETDRWNFGIPVAPACIWRNIVVDPLPFESQPEP